MHDNAILSVRELTERIKSLLEGSFPFVWVRGEVTNLARPGSGHVYFSLRDGDAMLNCVWFRGRQKAQEAFDPLTGEIFEDGPRPCLAQTMQEGDAILCAGNISVFGPRGQYQLIVTLAQEADQKGELLRRLEILRQKLAAEGLFARERKRPLPEEPERVALLTAPTGAAIQDFLRIARSRGTGASIRIYPVPVQGAEAPPRIIRALDAANADGWANVAVIIRGGGSLEDLWAFNDEALARAVAASRLPVLTGIGHEIDTSLCDLAADCRAATPSHAAQLLWHERRWHEQRLDACAIALGKSAQRHREQAAARLNAMEKAMRWFSPRQRLERGNERLKELRLRLDSRLQFQLQQKRRQVSGISEQFLRLARVSVPSRRLQEEEALERRFYAAMRRLLQDKPQRLALLAARLEGLNPYAPLARGYTMVSTESGKLVCGVKTLAPGGLLRMTFQDGRALARVEEILPDKG